ncbi:FAD-dependent oxidoreductase [Solirubrobacter ginsenosidimutans]|uniref:FAD-dependent oxidoreductase n=1 Tax=Solirubrobacter ginsenosidimutans TaxID=490573 RepID=A0A9X3MUV9_9ACTN|nr:FAD-dependent oxidoreductase [Solirubrobacter ginsenosidimutans]MDA0161705.1 FAD-dependent oxidoreductase [Solirubrobacter ginsenosidimutans]
MPASVPPLRVLVAGGGVAAIETVLALHALAGDRVAIELLAPGDEYVERPFSVRSPFSGEAEPRVTLEGLVALGVVHHHGALAAVEAERREVRTTNGGRLGYDRLVVAPGAHAIDGVPGSVTFRGPISSGLVEGAIRRAEHSLVFVAPAEAGWILPLYELALMTAHEFPDGPDIRIVTHEPRPLDVFGPIASDAVARLLERAGIEFIGRARAVEYVGNALVIGEGDVIVADAVVSLPRLTGPRIEGMPADANGFIPINANARVVGMSHVFAAGDATTEPIKQGGLATQQADAAAEMIAAEAGAVLIPRPYRRILRGVVLTGERPLYLRRDLDEAQEIIRPLRGVPPGVSRTQLWWPEGKIAGRYLTSFVASGGHLGAPLSDRPAVP